MKSITERLYKERQKMAKMVDEITVIKEEVCDNYCKYAADGSLGDIWDEEGIDICESCPLNRL